jgi:hypothetical protein
MRGTRTEKKRRNQRNTANCPHYRCHAHFFVAQSHCLATSRECCLCLCVCLWRKCSPQLDISTILMSMWAFIPFRLVPLMTWSQEIHETICNQLCWFVWLLLSTTGPIKRLGITGTLAADCKFKMKTSCPHSKGGHSHEAIWNLRVAFKRKKKETTDTISLLKGSGFTHGTGKRRFPSLAVTAASPIVQ